MTSMTFRGALLFLVAAHSAAYAASYRCPKPDGSLWPGWHDQCPEPSVDPNTWTPPKPEPIQCGFGDTELLAYDRCQDAVEDLARYTVRWTDGLLESKFPRAICAGRDTPEIILSGDRIEMQNGFGAWHRHGYQCIWNPVTKAVVSVKAVPR